MGQRKIPRRHQQIEVTRTADAKVAVRLGRQRDSLECQSAHASCSKGLEGYSEVCHQQGRASLLTAGQGFKLRPRLSRKIESVEVGGEIGDHVVLASRADEFCGAQ